MNSSMPNSGLVAALSLHEKVLLVTGADNWSTQGAEVLGLRPMIMSDGPAGARGVILDERHPSTSLPCPSALGATWDPGLVREIAASALSTTADSPRNRAAGGSSAPGRAATSGVSGFRRVALVPVRLAHNLGRNRFAGTPP